MATSVDLPQPLARLLAEAHASKENRPWVTLSYAQSLDGSIAAVRDRPLSLSGPESIQITHQLRASHQAILVGIGTVLADDPRLTVRLVDGEDPQPVVLDRRLRFPLAARLLENQKPPWIITANQRMDGREAALVNKGARILRVPGNPIMLVDVLQVLWQAGIRSVMVEGGAQVITAFLQARWVDAMVITIAPVLVGGIKGVEGLLSQELGKPDGFPRLAQRGSRQMGEDLLVWGRPSWG
jgi:riboflavin-specific deaminase-like protein